MGLSSSQGRLLLLTSRLSDIELRETLLSQRQNKLALDSMESANKYNNALNNYKIQIKVADGGTTSGFRNENLNYQNMSQAGYLVTDGNNNLYLTAGATGEEIQLSKDEKGEWIIPSGYDANLLDIDSTTGKASVLQWNTPKDAAGNSLVNISKGQAAVKGERYNLVNGNKYLQKEETLQNAIINGNLFLINTNNADSGRLSVDMLDSDTNLEYVLNTDDDAQAQSEHEYEEARISRQENVLEMEIKQLETEHEAILKEIDSVKSVISNNVDRTFKLFSGGG